MGYVFIIGRCRACQKMICFNPHKVPSIRVKDPDTGELEHREPLCKDCAEIWNQFHPDQAKPIQPDAYEPILEDEL